MARRSHGSGRPEKNKGGRESWYGFWWAGPVRVKRKLGLVVQAVAGSTPVAHRSKMPSLTACDYCVLPAS
jgi:hypothetical protein